MIWNPYFEFAALLLTVIINIFYWTQRRLPLYQNRIFSYILATELGVILSDLLASYVCSYHEKYTVAFQYFANMLYFMLLVLMISEFYFYTLSLTGREWDMSRKMKILLRIPFMVTEVLILLSPLKDLIFSVDAENGYRRGRAYFTIAILVSFYVSLSFIYILVYRKAVAMRQLVSICAFCTIIFVGMFLQVFIFPYILIINSCSAIAITIIYLSLQNPDFYINNVTGLFNSDAFMEISRERIGFGKNFSCLGLVVGRYSTARKIYGKEHLDCCMREIGAFLKSVAPEILAFYFNDGCFVLLSREGDDFEGIRMKVAERFESAWKLENGEVFFNINMTVLPEDIRKNSAAEVVDALQEAMDKVSYDGTDTCVNIDADMMKRMERDERIESALGRAVKNDSVEVYFQPIYSNGCRKIRSAEALARLYDPELGFIPPDEFIPKAEQNGSIMQLGRQVFEKTCRFIRDNDLDSLGIDYIEINLSPVQCLQERLADELLDAARKYGISMDRVNLEITETSTMDSDVTGNNMKKLVENGASFSLDDYGTGFSNLINILNLPLGIVKIDKSIVWSYFNDSRDILPHVIRMFRSQKLEILAEGVETEQMANELAAMGCDYEQGFYFSKPVPPAEFIRYVKKVNAG